MPPPPKKKEIKLARSFVEIIFVISDLKLFIYHSNSMVDQLQKPQIL